MDEKEILKRNLLVYNNLISDHSTWRQTVGHFLLTRGREMYFSEVWFRCFGCRKYHAAEETFFLQRHDEDSVALQSVSTFLPVSGQKFGFDENFDVEESINLVCGNCLTETGVFTGSIPVTNLTVSKEHLV